MISRFRFDEEDFTLRRLEIEGRATFDRWGLTVLYGNYDAQPELGFLTRREGVLDHRLGQGEHQLGADRRGALRHRRQRRFDQFRFGFGYIDDCFIMSLNYITDYNYSGNVETNHSLHVPGQPADAWRIGPGNDVCVGSQFRAPSNTYAGLASERPPEDFVMIHRFAMPVAFAPSTPCGWSRGDPVHADVPGGAPSR